MGQINRVEISGNLTAAPELKCTRGGNFIAKFGIAINRRLSDGSAAVDFFECVKFMGPSPSAEAQQFWAGLEKGRRVFIAGHLRQEKWVQDGQRRYSVSIIVDELDTLGRPSADPASYAPGQQMPIAAAPPQVPESEVYDEEIPF